ncbi:DEKNAAC104383 [Brettanomyces naardenensis]|uniref:Transcription factor n=1 Tax=Brettanomyces naardenensis TaxID=13370 RepID=A0A448YQS8_BRENA|nr:DEKNAAC104383 [Brettanomyces naardenensis]
MAASNSGDLQAPEDPNNCNSHNKGSGTDFVKKLFQMLEEDTFSDIVRWSDAGDSFIITDTNEFTTKVLPSYFKHGNFASFVRQLNKYDFHKVKLSHGVKQRYKMDNIWEFKHPKFSRHDSNALDGIKRKVPTKRESEAGVMLASPTNFVSITQFRNLQDHLDFLERDNQQVHREVNKLQAELQSLNGKYNSLVSTLLTSRTINESFSNAISTLSKALAQMGVQLPRFDIPLGANPPISRSPASASPAVASSTNSGPTNNNNNSNNTNNNVSLSPPQQPIKKQQQQQQPPPLQIAPLSPRRKQERILARPKGSNLHVLLVEDDNVCIQLCQKFLMKYGCTVVVVKDGLAAISAVEKVKFDLVLMDIVMPNLDGASATSVIRSFDSDTPIIAMTGNYQKEDLMTYLAHGMTDILAKPFTKLDLYMILEKHQIGNKLKRPSQDSASDSGPSSNPKISAPGSSAEVSSGSSSQQQLPVANTATASQSALQAAVQNTASTLPISTAPGNEVIVDSPTAAALMSSGLVPGAPLAPQTRKLLIQKEQQQSQQSVDSLQSEDPSVSMLASDLMGSISASESSDLLVNHMVKTEDPYENPVKRPRYA